MAEMVEARAHGGPRDGIKITAPITWNGRIPLPNQVIKQNARGGVLPTAQLYYNGYYSFQLLSFTWQWVDI